MADFASEEKSSGESPALTPLTVLYCPHCTMPPEYCENGPCFNLCLPWIAQNCPEVLGVERIEQLMAKVTVTDNVFAAPVSNLLSSNYLPITVDIWRCVDILNYNYNFFFS